MTYSAFIFCIKNGKMIVKKKIKLKFSVTWMISFNIFIDIN